MSPGCARVDAYLLRAQRGGMAPNKGGRADGDELKQGITTIQVQSHEAGGRAERKATPRLPI